MSDGDPGDEDDWRPPQWTCKLGDAVCYYPMRWFKEPVPPPAEHDAGDEDELAWWMPLSDVSRKRLEKQLLGYPSTSRSQHG